MTFTQDAAKILRDFGVVFSPTARLSQFAGLSPFVEFLKKGNFRERWTEQFGAYRARTMLQFVLGLVAGGRSIFDIGKLARDPYLGPFIQNPVEEAQLGRDVRSFDRQMIEALHELVMSTSIFDFAKAIPQTETLVFDIDATAVEKYGEQEGVEKGYVDRDKIEDCYQYLMVRLHNRNTIFYGTIRGGAAHSQNDFCGYLERFLPMLKKQWRSAWRADSGYFNERAFDLFSENDATFFIKAPMSETRLSLANTSQDLVWSKTEKGVSFASRITQTEQGTKYREIFKRALNDSKGQLSLGELESYRMDCLATNDLSIAEDAAFLFYNKRACIENSIRELKYDYHLGKIITDDFNANDVITQLTLLTYLLVRHFQIEVLPPKMAKMQLSTIRTELTNVPGSLFREGRKIFLRIQNIFADEKTYAFIFRKLRDLKSWVLEPPIFSEAAA